MTEPVNSKECDHDVLELVTAGEWNARRYEDLYRCADCDFEVVERFTSDGFYDGVEQFDISDVEELR
jgi:hypothetical protein